MTLHEAVTAFVERKRAEGLLYAKAEQNLLSLSHHVGRSALERVTARHVASFLDGPKTSPVTWERKYCLLNAFFQFWLARGAIQVLPLPAKRKTTSRAFIPYIYSHAEIKALLKATRRSQQEESCRIDALTMRTFLIFLYGTGALVGEALRLEARDVNLKKGLITIRAERSIELGISRSVLICKRFFVDTRSRSDESTLLYLISSSIRMERV